MKKFFSAIVSIMFLCDFFIFAEPLHVSIIENSPVSLNYYLKNDNNELYHSSSLTTFLAENNFQLSLEIYPKEKAFKYLEEGRTDLIYGVPKVPEYEDKFVYSKTPCSYGGYFLLSLLDNKKFFAGSFNSIDQESVGILYNDKKLYAAFMKECFLKNIHPRIIYYYSETAMQSDLYKGKVELILQNTNHLLDSEKIIYCFGSIPLYFLMNKNNKRLQTLINHTEKLFFRPNMVMTSDYGVNITGDEKRFIEKNKIIPLVMNNGFQKKSYDFITYCIDHPNEPSRASSEVQKLLNKMNTIYCKYFNQVEKISGLQFKSTEKEEKDSDKDEIYIAVEDRYAGNKDFVSIQNTIQTAKVWVITANGFHIDTFRNIPETTVSRELKIAVIKESFFWLPYFKNKFHQFRVFEYSDIRTCLKEVNRGTCDAFIIPDNFLNTVYDLSKYINLKKCTPYYYEIPIKIFVKGHDKEIIASIFNKVTKQINQNYIDNLCQREDIYSFYDSTKANVVKQRSNNIMYLVIIVIGIIIFYFFHNMTHYKKWALTDALTGIGNERYFDEKVTKYLNQNKVSGIALIHINIRGFKNINFIKGSSAGDSELINIAEILEKYETKNCIIAKGFADNFYILKSVKNEAAGINFCHKILEEFNQDKILKTSNSCLKIGITFKKQECNFSLKEMTAQSSYALKRAKKSLTESIIAFDKKMHTEFDHENFIEMSLQSAFLNKEFYVVFQPKVDFVTEQIVSCEALVRWNHPTLGPLLPKDFIPVMEKNGSIIDLDFYVYERAFEYLQSIIDSGINPIQMSLNMSRQHLNSDIFANKLMDLFSKFSIPKNLIEIEVVERSSGEEDSFLYEITNKIHSLGFEVAMDDFGIGESSLSMFTELPIDVIKFDQKFMSEKELPEKRKQLISSVTKLAKGFGQKTVCEGVRTREQVSFLKSIGCDMAQGFFFYKPLSGKDLKKLLNNK